MSTLALNVRPGIWITALSWLLQIVAALILAQTLFFKFTGAQESRFIFSALGVEPWGRYAAGMAELLAVALLLTPQTAAIGAAFAMAVMLGALGAHFTKLGIAVQGDGGLLFGLAWTVFLSAAGVLIIRRDEIARVVSAVSSIFRGQPAED